MLYLFSASNVELPTALIPRRERLDSGSSTTSERTEPTLMDIPQELESEIQHFNKSPPAQKKHQHQTALSFPALKTEAAPTVKLGSKKGVYGKHRRYSYIYY